MFSMLKSPPPPPPSPHKRGSRRCPLMMMNFSSIIDVDNDEFLLFWETWQNKSVELWLGSNKQKQDIKSRSMWIIWYSKGGVPAQSERYFLNFFVFSLTFFIFSADPLYEAEWIRCLAYLEICSIHSKKYVAYISSQFQPRRKQLPSLVITKTQKGGLGLFLLAAPHILDVTRAEPR